MTTITLAPKPSVSDEIKADVVDILRKALAQAEAGEIDAVIVIKKMPDGRWADNRSGVICMSDAIGKLEIIKQAWIIHYLNEAEPET